MSRPRSTEPPQWVDSLQLGKARRLDDAQGRYIEFCKSRVASDLSLKGLKIVVDAAHGAAYQVAPSVFHELGAEVVASAARRMASTSMPASARPRRMRCASDGAR